MSGDVKLEPCPFCGDERMPRHALWPSEGDSDGITHAHSTECPAEGFSIGTADEGVSVAVAWNRRSSSSAERAMREALEQTLWHIGSDDDRRTILDAGHGWKTDMFGLVEMVRAALSARAGEGDKQARPSGSAPISTDTKGTTK